MSGQACQIACYTEPCQGVDGDFYTFTRINSSVFEVLTGDVMGKGVTAALIGAGVKNSYRWLFSELMAAQAAKLALQTPGQPGYTPFGKLEAKDADFEWLQKKQAAVEEANFQLWFAQEYDRMSPAEKKRAKELYPEFYAQRKKLLKKQAKNLVRLASIKLEGVESFDDLRLQYEAETGRLDVGPLTHLLHPEQNNNDAAYEQRKFQRGLLSPFRVFGDEAVARTPGATVQQTRKQQAEAFNAYTRPEDGLGLTQGFPPLPSGGATTFAQTGDKDWFATMRSLLQ